MHLCERYLDIVFIQGIFGGAQNINKDAELFCGTGVQQGIHFLKSNPVPGGFIGQQVIRLNAKGLGNSGKHLPRWESQKKPNRNSTKRFRFGEEGQRSSAGHTRKGAVSGAKFVPTRQS